MKLADKGPFAPPPTLSGPAEEVAREVSSWPGVVSATHWYLFDRSVVDGVDFYVGERELGHLHLDGGLHLAATPGLREALVAEGWGRPASWESRGGWVETSVRRESDVELGRWLFRLNYDRLSGVPWRELQARVAERADRTRRRTA
jgi:hypothetical protein